MVTLSSDCKSTLRVCFCWAGLFAESSWLSDPCGPHTVLAGCQADGQGGVCQHSCLLRGGVNGHNVGDRLAASTAPPFLLLWPEINHKYPPESPLPSNGSTPANTKWHRHGGTRPLSSRHTQVKRTPHWSQMAPQSGEPGLDDSGT